MGDLLPCPFCGGEASAVEDTSHSTAYSVGCFNGKCALEPYVWDVSKTEAIAAWNRRAIPATDARAEALKEAADVASTMGCQAVAFAILALITETADQREGGRDG